MHIITIHEVYARLLLAMSLGLMLGFERFLAHKTAGIRTYTLISLGSAVFIVISQLVTAEFAGTTNFDPLRMAAQIVAAAGFLGVGAIFHNDTKISGVTTASGMWVAAGIGMACGFGLYQVAVLVTACTIFIFAVLWVIESRLEKYLIKKGDRQFPIQE